MSASASTATEPLSAYSFAPGLARSTPRQPLGIDVIGVLMRDQHRRQPGQRLEALREGAGIDQDARRPVDDVQAGMAVLADLS